MSYTLRMPEVAANATHATLVSWSKNEGETIEVGESIADVETDKAVLELPVEVGGVIGQLLVKNGAQVAVGAPIAILLAAGETMADMDKSMSADSPSETVTSHSDLGSRASVIPAVLATVPVLKHSASVVASKPAKLLTKPLSTSHTAQRIVSSPVARLLARSHGIDLATVAGSGPRGRIHKGDVELVIASLDNHTDSIVKSTSSQTLSASPSLSASQVGLTDPPVVVLPPTPMRQTIARRLSESKSTIPHFYLRVDCQVDALLAARKLINNGRDKNISVNDFVIKAVAVALIEEPQMNVSWRDDGLHMFSRADVCVAVATHNGLMTPIVRDANNQSLSSISLQIRELAALAKEGRLHPTQYQGGTFSVSNLGMYGIDNFDAIINPPQAGILAVGAVKAKPVINNETIAIGQVMQCVLSVDHRAVDGAVAARWLAVFKNLIENPIKMLV